MRETTKSRLNLTVNPNLIEIFASLEPIHKMTFSGFLEEKLMEYIQEIAPDKLMELEIQAIREKLSKLESELPAVKFHYGNLRKLKTESKAAKVNTEIENIESVREAAYQRHLTNIKYQIKTKKPFDWSRLQMDFRFKDRFECMNYIEGRLKAEGLMN